MALWENIKGVWINTFLVGFLVGFLFRLILDAVL